MGWETDAIKGFFDFLYKIVSPLFTKGKRLSLVMRDSIDITEIANDVITHGEGMTIDCVFLCLAFNGGKDGRYTYRSIIAGDWRWWMMNKFKIARYRRVHIDDEFAALIYEIKTHKIASRSTTLMHIGSLKAKYMFEGWEYVRYYYVDKTKEGLWYVFAATMAGTKSDFDDPVHVHRMNLAVKDIKNILSRHKK